MPDAQNDPSEIGRPTGIASPNQELSAKTAKISEMAGFFHAVTCWAIARLFFVPIALSHFAAHGRTLLGPLALIASMELMSLAYLGAAVVAQTKRSKWTNFSCHMWKSASKIARTIAYFEAALLIIFLFDGFLRALDLIAFRPLSTF